MEKGNSIDSEEQNEYRALCRGAATYVLLGQKHPPIEALEVARIYQLDLTAVSADIDVIVQSERHKKGGVFEVNPQA
jgi:hypothetical protein